MARKQPPARSPTRPRRQFSCTLRSWCGRKPQRPGSRPSGGASRWEPCAVVCVPHSPHNSRSPGWLNAKHSANMKPCCGGDGWYAPPCCAMACVITRPSTLRSPGPACLPGHDCGYLRLGCRAPNTVCRCFRHPDCHVRWYAMPAAGLWLSPLWHLAHRERAVDGVVRGGHRCACGTTCRQRCSASPAPTYTPLGSVSVAARPL